MIKQKVKTVADRILGRRPPLRITPPFYPSYALVHAMNSRLTANCHSIKWKKLLRHNAVASEVVEGEVVGNWYRQRLEAARPKLEWETKFGKL